MRNLIGAVLLCVLFGSDVTVRAEFRVANIFSDNMVLQRDKPIRIWGWAEPKDRVRVMLTEDRTEAVAKAGEAAFVSTLTDKEQKAREQEWDKSKGKPIVRLAYVQHNVPPARTREVHATAGKDGYWQVELESLHASFTPKYLVVGCRGRRVAFKNILVGEVWITAGQSNMAWAGARENIWEKEGLILNGLRYTTHRDNWYRPKDDLSQRSDWLVCEDGKLSRVSAIPYMFGKFIHRKLKVPVGIINAATGGSYGNNWASREQLEKIDLQVIKRMLAETDARVGPWTTERGRSKILAEARVAFGDPKLPFGIITLQGMGTRGNTPEVDATSNGYTNVRDIHYRTHLAMPHTGFICAHDVGGGVHPNWKRPVAERAAYWALRDVYQAIHLPRTHVKTVQFERSKVRIHFEQQRWGMNRETRQYEWKKDERPVIPRANDGMAHDGFAVAGKDRRWYPAKVTIDWNRRCLVVWSDLVGEPVALRYGWGGYPQANLGDWYDPIPPFRTDDWPVLRVGLGSAEENKLDRSRKFVVRNEAVRLDTLPSTMAAVLQRQSLQKQIAATREALKRIQPELAKLPDPKPVTYELAAPLLNRAKKSLTKRGIDWRRIVRGDTPITAEDLKEQE